MREVLMALLHKEPAHGYELKGAIESMFGEVWPAVNVGQIYSTLGRLERAGLVQSSTVTQASRPDKRVFELTAAGAETVRRWVDEVVPAAQLRGAFFDKLVLAARTRVADPIVLIDRQRRDYLRRLAELGVLVGAAQGLAARLAVEGAVLHLQADLRWLDYCEDSLTSHQDPGSGGRQ